MKVNLTYKLDLDDESQNSKFKQLLRATDMANALYEISQAFRSHEKYDAEPVTRDRFHIFLSQNNINLDELIY